MVFFSRLQLWSLATLQDGFIQIPAGVEETDYDDDIDLYNEGDAEPATISDDTQSGRFPLTDGSSFGKFGEPGKEHPYALHVVPGNLGTCLVGNIVVDGLQFDRGVFMDDQCMRHFLTGRANRVS